MKLLAYVLFYGYVILLIVAGAWGVFFGRFDQRLLFHMNPHALPPISAASMISQYRFLRAIEFGFGMFSIIYRREIFNTRAFNRLFLATMSLGVVARIVSIAIDGRPYPSFYFFLGSELLGVIFIYLYSQRTLVKA